MKLIVLCALFCLSYGKQMPEYLSNLRCHRSDPDLENCIYRNFDKAIPHLVKGVEEIGMPPLNPLELPFMYVNRTVNSLVRIESEMKNVKVVFDEKTTIDAFKVYPKQGAAEIRVTVPFISMEMEYEVAGQLLIVPLQSKGFFEGNFTNTQMYVKVNFKRYLKNTQDYYRVNKINSKIIVGNGHVKMTEKNPEMQFAADLIAEFYNENPRRVMDAVNPIFIETSNDLFQAVIDQVLGNLPASEWIPE